MSHTPTAITKTPTQAQTSSNISTSFGQMLSMSPKAIIVSQIMTYSQKFVKKVSKRYKSQLLSIILLVFLSSITMNFEKILMIICRKFKNINSWIFFKVFMKKEQIVLARNCAKVVINGKSVQNMDPEIYYNELKHALHIHQHEIQPNNFKIWKSIGFGKMLLHNIDNNKEIINLYYNKVLSNTCIDKIKKVSREKTLIKGRVVQLATNIHNSRFNMIEKTQQTMYPNKKYCDLHKQIKNFFMTNELINKHKPIAIVLNGPPGTGKSCFCDYISQKGICKTIIKINMLKFSTKPFNEILNALTNTHQLENNDLICFDELDKYFSMYLEHVINTNVHNNTSTENNDKQENISKCEIKQETTDKLSQKYRIMETNNFLSLLMTLIDGEEHSKNVIYVFCANNFDSIYKHASDHFNALKTRFITEKIEPYNRHDVMEFLGYYNRFLIDTDLHVNLNNIDLPQELKISVRHLNQLLITNHYNILITLQNIREMYYINNSIDDPINDSMNTSMNDFTHDSI